MGEGDTGGDTGVGEWLSVAAAARRLGISPRSIRGRVARGTLTWKPAGNIGKLVLVVPGDGPAVGTRDALEGDAVELAQLREEVLDALLRAARAEELAMALQSQLDREVARADRLEAQIARSWWRRLIG